MTNEAGRRWLEERKRRLAEKHQRRVDTLAQELERRYKSRPRPDQDEAVARHLRYVVETADPELRQHVQRFVAEVEAQFRARRTYREHWGPQRES